MRSSSLIVSPTLPKEREPARWRTPEALKLIYQATVMCAQKDSPAVSNETMNALTRGLVESLIYILIQPINAP